MHKLNTMLNVWTAIVTTLGTICVIVTLILVLRNRPKLKVTFDETLDPVNGFRIVAENVGGIPMYTRDVGLKLSSGKTLWAYYIDHDDNSKYPERLTAGKPILLGRKREYLIDLENVLIDSNTRHIEYKGVIDTDKVVAFVSDRDGRCFWSHDCWRRFIRLGRVSWES